MNRKQSAVTKKAIADEVKWLKENQHHIRRYNAFGSDNWRLIDAQIKVLEDGLEEGDIYDMQTEEEGSEWDSEVVSAAMDAHRWAEGEARTAAPRMDWFSLMPEDTRPLKTKKEKLCRKTT